MPKVLPIHIPGSWKISALTYFYSCSQTPDVYQRSFSATPQGKHDDQPHWIGPSLTSRAADHAEEAWKNAKVAPASCMHAKLLQLYPTLSNFMDLSHVRLLCPWDSPGKDTGVGRHSLLLPGLVTTLRSLPGAREVFLPRQWVPGPKEPEGLNMPKVFLEISSVFPSFVFVFCLGCIKSYWRHEGSFVAMQTL